MIKKIIFGIAILFTANACQQAKVEPNAMAYFSLKGFIDGQLKNVQGSQASYRKVVKVNDHFEIKKIKSVDLSEDLKGFLSYDINKNDWKNWDPMGKNFTIDIYSDEYLSKSKEETYFIDNVYSSYREVFDDYSKKTF